MPATNPTPIAKQKISRDNPGRTFEVVGTEVNHFGDWKGGDRFTEYEFRKRNEARPTHISADDYFADILDGHLKSNRIRIIG